MHQQGDAHLPPGSWQTQGLTRCRQRAVALYTNYHPEQGSVLMRVLDTQFASESKAELKKKVLCRSSAALLPGKHA